MTDLSDSIIELRAQGYTYNRIQEELGCSKGTISYHLGVDQKAKNADRRRRHRRAVADFLVEYKQSNPCADCGEYYPYWVMQFDHLRDKLFNISQYRHHGKNLEEVKAEVEKCDLVCANCHATRSHLRRPRDGSERSEFQD